MKASSIVPVIFLLLFLGVNLSANAQAGASMSYTIVIAENSMDYGDSYDDRGFDMPENCKESERVVEAVTKASNEIQATVNSKGVNNIYNLEKNLKMANLLASVNIRDENGSLAIIMEYN